MGRSFGVIVLGLAILIAVGAVCGSEQDAPPNPTSNVPEGSAANIDAVQDFDGFPIVWLGESYDSDGDGIGDMPLTTAETSSASSLVDPTTGTELRPKYRTFSLAYGTCEIAVGDESCPVPISIHIYPPDSVPPFSRGGATVRVRGIDAIHDGGMLWIETADFTVSISFSGRSGYESSSQVIRIANALVGGNDLAAHLSAGADFRPVATDELTN